MNLYTYKHRYICIYIHIIYTVPIFTIFSHFLLRLSKKYPPSISSAAEMKQLKMARLSKVPVAIQRWSWNSWRDLLGERPLVMSENWLYWKSETLRHPVNKKLAENSPFPFLNMPWFDRFSVAMQVCQSVLVLFVSVLCPQSYLFTSGKFWKRCDFTTLFGRIEIHFFPFPGFWS